MTSSYSELTEKRRLLWLFSGMATQWNGMGRDFLKIPVFKQTIDRCHAILARKGIDLIHILTTDDEKIFESNVLNCMIGIGAVQIGMVNILRELGIEPDYLVGTSFGELAAGYMDGGLTGEETMLSAYFRGSSILEISPIVGQAAFVGLSAKELSRMIPEDCDDIAHMDPNATVVAGPRESVFNFLDQVKEMNRFTSLTNCSDIAFHSRYISNAGPVLLKKLHNLIPNPKRRTKRWLSTSVHPEQWTSPEAQKCSGEYYVNNLLGCIYLEEAFKLVPRNCIVLEIAPHCLLRATARNNFPEGAYVQLADKRKENNLEVFLNALKVLDENGVKMNWSKVYKVIGIEKKYL